MYLSRGSCAFQYHAAKARVKMIADHPRPGKHRGPAKPIEIVNAIEILDIQFITVAGGTLFSEPAHQKTLGRHYLKAIVVKFSRLAGIAEENKAVIKGGCPPAIGGLVEIDGVRS